MTSHPEPKFGNRAPAPPRLASEGGAYVHIRSSADVEDELARASDLAAPLAGWTLGVKDLIAVAGLPLGAGSRARADAAPERNDAPIVARLRGLGAALVGTTALHELAFGVTGINDYAGTPENPRLAGAVPGGSSSGSAVAVAEGSARIALGTDTGGSVRIPAALCGVVGFKPRYGVYSTAGVLPLAPSLDHVGLLARSVADVCTVHEALGNQVGAPGVRPRIGLIKQSFEAADAAVIKALERLLTRASDAGCTISEVAWPDPELVMQASTTIMFAEAYAVHRNLLERCPQLIGADVRLRLETGSQISASAVAEAARARSEIRTVVAAAFDGLDGVLGPTVGCPPPQVRDARDGDVGAGLVLGTRVANLSGVAALSLPVAAELPVGVQVMAASDQATLALGAWLERLGGVEAPAGSPSARQP